MFPSFDIFNQVMDQCTENYHCLYINNFSKSNKWQDCVFYWKAPLVPEGWKVGCPEYWDFHEERFNKEYTDPVVF